MPARRFVQAPARDGTTKGHPTSSIMNTSVSEPIRTVYLVGETSGSLETPDGPIVGTIDLLSSDSTSVASFNLELGRNICDVDYELLFPPLVPRALPNPARIPPDH